MAVAGATYANSLANGFVLDDRWLVLRNPLIRGLGRVPELFASSYYAPNMELGLYRPVATLSLALNHAVGGLDPVGYHAWNVALHAACSVLVLALAWLVGARPFVAAGAGLLFAVHAVHTEAVANVAGRAELLAAAFFLLALVLHRACESASRDLARWLRALSLASAFLALLSKENALALLPTLVALDWILETDRRRPPFERARALVRERALRVYGGYVVVLAGYAALRIHALGLARVTPPTPVIDNPLVLLPFPWSLVSALEVAWRYARLLLFPGELSYDYSYAQIPLIHGMGDPRGWAVLAGSAVAWWAAIRLSRPSPLARVALVLAALTFLPVSNLGVRIGTILGERLLYLPSVGICIVLAWAIDRASQRLPWREPVRRGLAIAVVALAVGAHAGRALVRNPDWRSAETLYLHDVEVSPRSAKALNNAGWILIDRDLDVARGVAMLERALEIWPDEPEYLDSLGWGYYKLGRLSEARARLRRSLELAPTGATAGDRRAHLRAVEAALREP